MKRILEMTLALLLVTAACSVAQAQMAAPPMAPAPVSQFKLMEGQSNGYETYVRRPSYKKEMLAVDFAALGLMLFGAHVDSPALAWAGLGVYAAGPAVLHAARHDRPVSVWGLSFLMRTGFPIAGAFIGYKLDLMNCEDQFLCGFGGLLAGFLGGALAAIIIDYQVFAAARDEAIVSPRPNHLSATIAPAPVRGGMALTMQGRF